MMIKLSLLDFAPILQGVEPREALRQTVLLAQAAERLGFTRFWVPEHHDMEHLASMCPEVLLAHIGAQTERIRLGSGAVLLPHYKPIKVAETFHLLATLHPGRIDLGIGRAPGGSAHVTMALSDNFLDNVRRFPESLQALTELLDGKYRVEDTPVAARPVPPSPPELWLLGTNRKSAEYAARYGAGYVFGQFMSERDASEALSIYRGEFRPSRLLQEPRAIIAVGAICAETEAEARRLAAAGAGRLFAGGNDANGSGTGLSDRLLVGTPGQVKERLLRMEADYRVDEFMLVTPAPDYASRHRSIELLACSVLTV